MVFEIAVIFMLSYNSSVHLEAVTEQNCQNGTLWLYLVNCFLICATIATTYVHWRIKLASDYCGLS